MVGRGIGGVDWWWSVGKNEKRGRGGGVILEGRIFIINYIFINIKSVL